MERRELLKIMAMTIGGSIALPESVFAKMGEAFNPADLTFFSDAQRAQVAMLAEAIIPETDTPGAIAAGVPGWIEVIVKDCYLPADQKIITEGLAEITMRCAKENGKSIGEMEPAAQVAFLTKVDNETKAAKRALAEQGQRDQRHLPGAVQGTYEVLLCELREGSHRVVQLHACPRKMGTRHAAGARYESIRLVKFF